MSRFIAWVAVVAVSTSVAHADPRSVGPAPPSHDDPDSASGTYTDVSVAMRLPFGSAPGLESGTELTGAVGLAFGRPVGMIARTGLVLELSADNGNSAAHGGAEVQVDWPIADSRRLGLRLAALGGNDDSPQGCAVVELGLRMRGETFYGAFDFYVGDRDADATTGFLFGLGVTGRPAGIAMRIAAGIALLDAMGKGSFGH